MKYIMGFWFLRIRFWFSGIRVLIFGDLGFDFWGSGFWFLASLKPKPQALDPQVSKLKTCPQKSKPKRQTTMQALFFAMGTGPMGIVPMTHGHIANCPLAHTKDWVCTSQPLFRSRRTPFPSYKKKLQLQFSLLHLQPYAFKYKL